MSPRTGLRALGNIVSHPRCSPRTRQLECIGICCGTTLGAETSSRRYAKSLRRAPRAPSTREASRARKEEVYDPDNKSKLRLNSESYKLALYWRLAELHKAGVLTVTAQELVDFWDALETLPVNSRDYHMFELDPFIALQRHTQINNEDCLTLAKVLHHAPPPEFLSVYKPYSIRIPKTLSEGGYVPATLWIMGGICETARKKRHVLSNKAIEAPYRHLRRVADHPDGDFQAKNLLGRIEYVLGNEKRAIALWQDALRCMKTQEIPKATSYRFRFTASDFASRPDHFQLQSPYIDLALVHNNRSKRGLDEMEACRQALEEGCRRDDPWSHYHKSVHVKEFDSHGNHNATSSWLYHVTKAANSAHARAMFDLGVFYVESGWKYLENEPPDHVKPTPFDSSPSPKQPTLSDQIRQLLGLQSPPKLSAEDEVWRTAAVPNTATERTWLGIVWIKSAIKHGYAPACIYLARILLKETLWGAATAPRSAISLHPDRYSRDPEAQPDAQAPELSKLQQLKQVPDDVDEPNTWYDPARATDALTDFWAAYIAYEAHQEFVSREAKSDDFSMRQIERAHVFGGSSPWITRWWMNSDLRESYEKDMPRLLEEAVQLCDEHSLVIRAPDGSDILYPIPDQSNLV